MAPLASTLSATARPALATQVRGTKVNEIRRLLALYCGHTDCHNGDPDKPACQQIQDCLCYLRATLKVTAAQPPATCAPHPVSADGPDGSDGALPENGRGNEGHQLIHTYYRAAPPPKGAGQGAEAKVNGRGVRN